MDTIEARRVVAAVAAYRDSMVEFTKALVAIPTENPPGAVYPACVRAIANKLRDLGLDHTVLNVPPDPALAEDASDPYPRSCVIGSHGGGARTLYFHGHYDVVPASVAGQFEPRVDGGRLFGRGSSDMKSGLAAMIHAVAALRDAEISLDGRVGLVIVPDEETGGRRGSRYLAEAGLLGRGGIGMLTAEPTGGVVWNANRGAITLRVTVKGKPAHVGLQHEGINAFEHMLVVAEALRDLKTEVEGRVSAFALEPEIARHSILMLGGRCEGGTNFNVVPAECSFTVERRINPEEDLQAEKARLFGVLDRLRDDGIDLAVEILQEAPSSGSPDDSPLALALADSIVAETGRAPAFELCPGLLEIRFYAQKGMPAYAYGPGLLSVSHGPGEFVEVDKIATCAAIYARTALRLLGA
ncbi:MAG TPA: ArgE/DapE family deacylase [Chloroflexota bacterium]|nr:ArgE/DapE family deacylase [Chloroflexota bacterium]